MKQSTEVTRPGTRSEWKVLATVVKATMVSIVGSFTLSSISKSMSILCLKQDLSAKNAMFEKIILNQTKISILSQVITAPISKFVLLYGVGV